MKIITRHEIGEQIYVINGMAVQRVKVETIMVINTAKNQKEQYGTAVGIYEKEEVFSTRGKAIDALAELRTKRLAALENKRMAL